MTRKSDDRFQFVRDEFMATLEKWRKDGLVDPEYRRITEQSLVELLPCVDDIYRAHKDIQYIQQSVFALQALRVAAGYLGDLRNLMKDHEKLRSYNKKILSEKASLEQQIESMKSQIRTLTSSCISEAKVVELLNAKESEISSLKETITELSKKEQDSRTTEESLEKNIRLLNQRIFLLSQKSALLQAENEQLKNQNPQNDPDNEQNTKIKLKPLTNQNDDGEQEKDDFPALNMPKI